MVFKYIKDERGIALVIAMVFSLAIFAAAMAFTYRLKSFIRTTKSSEVKSQSLYTTDVGVELLRYSFWLNSCSPPNWCAAALCPAGLQQNSYCDVTNGIIDNNFDDTVTSTGYYSVQHTKSEGQGQINIEINRDSNSDSSFNLGTVVNTYNYDVYLKNTAIQNTIEVLASSEDQEAKANTGAAIIFAIPCSEDYKQFGQCVGKEGSSGEKVDTLAMRGPF